MTQVYDKRLWQRYLNTNNVSEVVIYLDDTDSRGNSLIGTGDQSGGRTFYAPNSLIMEIWRYCAWHGIPALAYDNGGMQANRWYKDEDVSGIGYAAAHEPFWYGIPSVQFIYHGEWSDPEIYYRGRYYNAAVAEEELYAIWREQIEYGDTEQDFDTWMQTAGGEYLKSDVLPYM